MNTEFMRYWANELRDGKYEQGVGKLRSIDDKFCCLAVGVDLIDSSKWIFCLHGYYNYVDDAGSNAIACPPSLANKIGWQYDSPFIAQLIKMNDHGVPFSEIADQIDKWADEYERI
jgi:hypothetical protein